MIFLVTVLSLFWFAGFFPHLVGTCLVVLFNRKSKRAAAKDSFKEPISILKPLHGVEPGLKSCLRSLFQLDYPDYEIIFSLEDPFDEARTIVQDLMKTYSGVKCRLVITGTSVGENPRINNLYISYRTAKNDTILISQTNIQVPRNYLSQLSNNLTKDVGLVTGVCTSGRANGIGGWLQLNYMGTLMARLPNIGFFFERPVMVGNTILFRRTELDKLGGLEALSHQIAENYMAANLYQKAKRKVVFVREPVTQYLTGFSFFQYWRHQLDQARIHKSYSLAKFLFEPFSSCFFAALCGGIAFQLFTHETWFIFFMAHLALSSVEDLFLMRLNGERVDLTNFSAWWICESLNLLVWLHALMGNRIVYKGTTLSLGRDGKVIQSEENEKKKVEPNLMSEDGIFTIDTQEISLSLARS